MGLCAENGQSNKTYNRFIDVRAFAYTSLFGMPLQLESSPSLTSEDNTFDGRLHSLWERYRAARDSGDVETCQAVHRELVAWKAQGGAQIFELAGYLFLEQGLNRLSQGQPEAARQEFIYAVEMNPYLWPAYDGLARIKKQEGRFQQYLNLTLKGISKTLSLENSYFFIDALVWLLFNLAWVVVLGFSIIAIILSLKYLRPMYKTTMGYFEYHQVSPLYGTLLSLVLLLSPLFLGVNLTLLGAIVVVLFYPFYNSSERKVTMAVFAIAMSLPILNLSIIRLSDIRSDQLLKTQMAQYFTGVDQRLEGLKAGLGQGQLRNHSLLVMGILQAAQGEDLQALDSLENVEKSSPLWALAQVNIGNIRFKKQKEYQMAISAYEEALKVNPEQGEALYNLHVVYSAMDKVVEADKYRTRAFDSSHSTMERAQLAAPGEVLNCAPDYSKYFVSAIFDITRFPGSFSISSFELWSPWLGYSFCSLVREFMPVFGMHHSWERHVSNVAVFTFKATRKARSGVANA